MCPQRGVSDERPMGRMLRPYIGGVGCRGRRGGPRRGACRGITRRDAGRWWAQVPLGTGEMVYHSFRAALGMTWLVVVLRTAKIAGTRPGALAAIVQNFQSGSARRINQARGTRCRQIWQADFLRTYPAQSNPATRRVAAFARTAAPRSRTPPARMLRPRPRIGVGPHVRRPPPCRAPGTAPRIPR